MNSRASGARGYDAADIAGLIAAVRAAAGIMRPDGDMIELAAPRPLPRDLVARIRDAKSARLSALGEAPDWAGL